ncbi:MAG: SDR family NAD(P)-dependent oxidoreductase [Candidatus Zixiibacteriota bacterium]|nr:MAG: SDR family NAD(P)-dependent oxidoreductase [candidate division Zixibacteria bacterium]
MPESKQSILITGANGFVGSRLCRTFLDNGFNVIAGVRKNADLRQLRGLEVPFRYGDICIAESLGEMVAGVDYIVHNAGLVKAKSEEHFFEVNEQGTGNLFEAIIRRNPDARRVIYISSAAAAGPSQGGVARAEDDPPAPLTEYGRSKLAGERTALSYADKLNVLAVRPPAIYGPGDREILSFFLAASLRIKPYIGSTRRKMQLVYVDDLCRGVLLAVSARAESGRVYYIAENRAYMMKELIKILGKTCGKSAVPLYVPSPVFRLIASFSERIMKSLNLTPMLTVEKANELLASWEVSTSRAEKELGYTSQVPFEEGARETFRWYRTEGWL